MVKNPPRSGDLGSILGCEDSLETGMASHSSILPGEFHEQRSLAGNGPEGRRVGHNGATFTFNFIVIYLLCALIMPSEIIEITVTAELLDPQEHT